MFYVQWEIWGGIQMTQPAGAVIVAESQWARVESQFIW